MNSSLQRCMVLADCLPIPDGFVGNDQVGIAIQVTPVHPDHGSAEANVSLPEWPRAILNELPDKLSVFVRRANGSPVHAFRPNLLLKDTLSDYHGLALDIWKESFRYEQDGTDRDDFENLFSALKKLPSQSQSKVSSSGSAKLTKYLSVYFDQRRKFDLDDNNQKALYDQSAKARSRLWKMASAAYRGQLDQANHLFQLERSNRSVEQAVADLFFGSDLLVENKPEDLKAAENKLLADLSPIVKSFEECGALFREETGDNTAQQTSYINDDNANNAFRKLNALLTFPSIANFLGLGMEVSISLSELAKYGVSDGYKGQIAAGFSPSPVEGQKWVAFELSQSPKFFFPSAKDRSALEPLFVDGHLNMNAKYKNKEGTLKRQFQLSALAANIIASETAANGGEEPSERRRGISLLDQNTESIDEDSRMETDPFHLDDLWNGIRPDIQQKSASDKWYETTARRIICQDIPESYYKHGLVEKRVLPRDFAYSVRIARLPKETPTSGPIEAVKPKVEDELFIWAGETFGLSRGTEETLPGQPTAKFASYTILDRFKDLGLNLKFEPASRGTTLRENGEYFVGCRAVLPGGVSVSLNGGAAYQQNAALKIGSTSDPMQPLKYPAFAISAPDVHLLHKDPLIFESDPQSSAGESSHTMVVRDYGRATRRIVTPPRKHFDDAEIQGQFDNYRGPGVPPGAFESTSSDGVRLGLYGDSASFPEARFAGIYDVSSRPGQGEGPQAIRKKGTFKDSIIDLGNIPQKFVARGINSSRGTVAYPSKDVRDIGRFYPDKNARKLTTELVPTGQSKEHDPKQFTVKSSFWNTDQDHPNTAKPILLKLSPSHSPESDLSSYDNVSVQDYSASLSMIEVKLPRASIRDIKLRIQSSNEPIIQQKVRLVHAVKRPDISKMRPDLQKPKSGIGTVTVSVSDEKARQDSPNEEAKSAHHNKLLNYEQDTLAKLATWDQYVHRNRIKSDDRRTWVSEAGGKTTFFVGQIPFDRAASGSVSVAAEWADYNTNTITPKKNSKEGYVKHVKTNKGTLFQFEVDREAAEEHLDLLETQGKENNGSNDPDIQGDVRNSKGKAELRALSFPFPNYRENSGDGGGSPSPGRARRLKVKLTTHSAFKKYYSDSNAENYTTSIVYDDVWTLSTHRPKPIDQSVYIESRLRWTYMSQYDERAERKSTFRIWLGDDWYETGEGEEVGIVILPEGSADDSITGLPEEFQKFVSRASLDPTLDPVGSPPKRLEPSHFGKNWADDVADVGLSLNDSNDENPTNTVQLSVIRLPVGFEETCGAYVDLIIDLDGGSQNQEPFMPFIQLGLVRYQHHSVDALRSSHPICRPLQLLPDRRLWVQKLSKKRRRLYLEARAFPSRSLHDPILAPSSSMEVIVQTWDENSKSWKQSSIIRSSKWRKVGDWYRLTVDFQIPDNQNARYLPQANLHILEQEQLVDHDGREVSRPLFYHSMKLRSPQVRNATNNSNVWPGPSER